MDGETEWDDTTWRRRKCGKSLVTSAIAMNIEWNDSFHLLSIPISFCSTRQSATELWRRLSVTCRWVSEVDWLFGVNVWRTWPTSGVNDWRIGNKIEIPAVLTKFSNLLPLTNICIGESFIQTFYGLVFEDDFYFRKKTRWELTRISAAVMGIEFCYAAETAFVSPRLLEIGTSVKIMKNRMKNDWRIFYYRTSTSHDDVDLVLESVDWLLSNTSTRFTFWRLLLCLGPKKTFHFDPLSWNDIGYTSFKIFTFLQCTYVLFLNTAIVDLSNFTSVGLILVPHGTDFGVALGDKPTEKPTMGILLTVLGTVLLDFDADACQSPARAYMLDTTIPGSRVLHSFYSLQALVL